MTDDEWEFVSGVLEECWPGEWTERTGPAYKFMLASYSFAAVSAALKAWAASGKTFRPSASDLLSKLHSDPGEPTWTEAFAAIFGRRGVLSKRDERECLAFAYAEFHPFIAAFVDSKGVGELKMLGIYDDEWGSARREQLRKEWEAFSEVAKERAARGLPLVTGGKTGGLQRMSPLAELGIAPPPELEAAD